MTPLALLIVVSLFLLWNLEFIATLLNLKTFPATPPPELDGLMDQEKLDLARSYLNENSRFDIIRSSISLAILLAFWFLGGFPFLDGIARSLSENVILAGLIFLGALFLAQNLISLPFDWYETFVIEEKFGFNKSTLSTFITDRIKGLALSAILGLPLAAGILWIFHEVPHAWLWAWAFVTAFQLILTYLAPSLILPLFNKFTPMPDGELKDGIHALGVKCGTRAASGFALTTFADAIPANAR